jgi:hypothetical protein
MAGYIDSGKMGDGKSLIYFFRRTAARCGSPKVSIDTTFPRRMSPEAKK